MKWKQTEFVHKCPMSTAWDKELFYSNVYPPNGSTKWIDTDTPENAIFENSNVRYEFNEYGFRSDPFFKEADIKLLVNGCSMTFGVGIEYEKTWPRLLKKKIEAETGKTVSVWNLAISGSSGDYVSRSIYKIRTFFSSKESNSRYMFIYWPPISRLELPDPNNREKLHQCGINSDEFLNEFKNESYLKMNQNKNLLAVTSSNAMKIPNQNLVRYNFTGNVGFMNHEDIFFDTYARDGQHPGEDWHERVAQMFFKQWLDK